MGDTEETRLEGIEVELQTQRLESAIDDVQEEVSDELEEVIETVDDAIQEVLDRPPDLIITPPAEIDYERLASAVVDEQDRRSTPAPVGEETEETEEDETETPVTPDEPPGHNSFLYKKRT